MDAKILYDYAMRHVGLPYRWGGDDPLDGYDCSGFVIELLQSVGVFPHGKDATAHDLFNLCRPTSGASFGALCFYGSQKKITHVGFCLDANSMLEAGGGDSRTISIENATKQNAYIRIRPISFRRDLVGIRMPNYPWPTGR